MKNILLIILITVLGACSSADNGVYTKSTTVENGLKKNRPSSWREVDNQGSDYALHNSKTDSYFIFNSACRKFDPSNLPTLTNSILSGINDVEIIEKKMTDHQGREAVLVTAKGSMDGISRHFRILTTQKNNCIYDYALISVNANTLEADKANFDSFTQQLKLN